MGVGSLAPVLYSVGVGMPGVKDVEMMHLVASGMDIFPLTGDLDSICWAGHENSPFCLLF